MDEDEKLLKLYDVRTPPVFSLRLDILNYLNTSVRRICKMKDYQRENKVKQTSLVLAVSDLMAVMNFLRVVRLVSSGVYYKVEDYIAEYDGGNNDLRAE